ncbi:TIGR04219 family outer membrane beta-barrel protein [Thalassotalea montiporae]
MRKTLIAAGLASLMSTAAHADVVGLYIGAQIWDNEAEGIFGESGQQRDFNLGDEQQGSYFIAVEHPIPLIPNVRIASTTLDTTGSTQITEPLEFDDQNFAAGAQVAASFDVSYIDYTLYYELFDNGLFSFDFGLTARDFDGDVTLSSQVTSNDSSGNPVSNTVEGKINTSEIVPMLYASTEVGLMFTGLSLFANGNFLSIDDHTLYDYQLGVNYAVVDNIAIDVNLQAGYRSVKLELDDLDDLYSDLEFDGVFAGVTVHF